MKLLMFDSEMAQRTMAALAISFDEGLSYGDEVERRLISELYKHYPETVKKYDYIPEVKKIINEKPVKPSGISK